LMFLPEMLLRKTLIGPKRFGLSLHTMTSPPNLRIDTDPLPKKKHHMEIASPFLSCYPDAF
jgi:hypothetical protein